MNPHKIEENKDCAILRIALLSTKFFSNDIREKGGGAELSDWPVWQIDDSQSFIPTQIGETLHTPAVRCLLQNRMEMYRIAPLSRLY